MALYADSPYPVPPETDALHADELASFGQVGTWGSARQRLAIAAEARKARVASAVQESVGDEALAATADLPEAARRTAQAVACGGININRDFCAQVQAEGVTEGAYVEIVGITARLAHLDVFARGLGIPARTLPAPNDDAPPTYERPAAAKQEGFFTATIPSAPEGGEAAVALYGNHPAPNILRSLSLVPDEARRVIRILDEEYFSLETIFDLGYSSHEALSRPQIELIAARVSALNQCFY